MAERIKRAQLGDSAIGRRVYARQVAQDGSGSGQGKRSLRATPLTLMTLGGIIGSGLFLASGQAIRYAGPGVALGYLIGALAMALEIAALAEMAAAEPVSGSFITYARKALGPGAAFVGGWIFWFSSVLNLGAEATAGGIFSRLWFPHVPTWVFAVGYSLIITALNSLTVKGFGSVESVMAAVKVGAIALFVVAAAAAAAGAWHLSGPASSGAAGGHLLPFFPHGFVGVSQAMVLVTFSLAGTGVIGLAASQAIHPERNVREAIHRTVALIFVLYAAAALAITWWVPFAQVPTQNASPFVAALHHLGLPWAAALFNGVILVAVLSAMSAGLFATDRVLHALAQVGDAPSFFRRMTGGGVPLRANLFTGGFLAVAAFLAFFLPKTAFLYLVTATGFQALFVWMLIVYTQLRYRRHLVRERGRQLRLRVPFFPWATWFELALLLGVVCTALWTPGELVPLGIGAAAVLGFWLVYVLLRRGRPDAASAGGGGEAAGSPRPTH